MNSLCFVFIFFCIFVLQVTWDGHSGSMARTQQAAQANITLQEQIEAIHKAKGLVGEDETKEKIGPSKPSDIHHPPPIPSSAPSLPKPSPAVTAVPRPSISVSCYSKWLNEDQRRKQTDHRLSSGEFKNGVRLLKF